MDPQTFQIGDRAQFTGTPAGTVVEVTDGLVKIEYIHRNPDGSERVRTWGLYPAETLVAAPAE